MLPQRYRACGVKQVGRMFRYARCRSGSQDRSATVIGPKRYDSEALVDFLIKPVLRDRPANLYLGSSDGSSGGGQQ